MVKTIPCALLEDMSMLNSCCYHDNYLTVHRTGSIESFSYGVADRGGSIRIPRECDKKQCGYFEDRRPASNADPYQITGIMMETIGV